MAADNPNYPIGTASVSWTDGSGGVHIRVYSTDGYTVSERCWDNSSWTSSAFNGSGSAVSATCWQAQGQNYIRVYCTSDDATVEYCSDAGGPWYTGGFVSQ